MLKTYLSLPKGKEIKSLNDLKGLRVRMSGMHAEVLSRIGAVTVNIPGGEIMTSLQSGVVDGVEWGGPWMDLVFGFHKVAPYCYGPGLHEPGLNTSLTINKEVYDLMPDELKNIIELCCYSEITESLAEFNFRNALLYEELFLKHNVQFRTLPEDVVESWVKNSEEVISEIAKKDNISKKIYQSWSDYRKNAKNISKYYDLGFLQSRNKFTKIK